MPHILIVDDEPSTSWALSEGLTDDGFTIDTFRSAEEAWTWLQSGRSDLVITDVRLPGMSGLDLARKLQHGRHAQPVILMTASDGDAREAIADAGVVECFPKPFAVDELRRTVFRALDDAARHTTPRGRRRPAR